MINSTLKRVKNLDCSENSWEIFGGIFKIEKLFLSPRGHMWINAAYLDLDLSHPAVLFRSIVLLHGRDT